VSSRTEKKRGKKEKKRKKATNIKPDIFLPNTLPRNGDNIMRIKMLL
jgi:hypothetical protein